MNIKLEMSCTVDLLSLVLQTACMNGIVFITKALALEYKSDLNFKNNLFFMHFLVMSPVHTTTF